MSKSKVYDVQFEGFMFTMCNFKVWSVQFVEFWVFPIQFEGLRCLIWKKLGFPCLIFKSKVSNINVLSFPCLILEYMGCPISWFRASNLKVSSVQCPIFEYGVSNLKDSKFVVSNFKVLGVQFEGLGYPISRVQVCHV